MSLCSRGILGSLPNLGQTLKETTESQRTHSSLFLALFIFLFFLLLSVFALLTAVFPVNKIILIAVD